MFSSFSGICLCVAIITVLVHATVRYGTVSVEDDCHTSRRKHNRKSQDVTHSLSFFIDSQSNPKPICTQLLCWFFGFARDTAAQLQFTVSPRLAIDKATVYLGGILLGLFFASYFAVKYTFDRSHTVPSTWKWTLCVVDDRLDGRAVEVICQVGGLCK